MVDARSPNPYASRLALPIPTTPDMTSKRLRIHGSAPARPAGMRALVPAAVAVLVGSTAMGACDDDLSPVWFSVPDTVVLFTLARPELNLPSAFSFTERRTYRVEGPGSTGAWDLAVGTDDGTLVLLPPGALGIPSRAGIAPLDGAIFEELDRAPRDTARYVFEEPVPAEIGRVYAIQTNIRPGRFGGTCVHYAKMEPLEMDSEAGTLTFLFDANPVCNDNRLIPPE